jgi:hypothetical protein
MWIMGSGTPRLTGSRTGTPTLSLNPHWPYVLFPHAKTLPKESRAKT